jgi:hypothetical protein
MCKIHHVLIHVPLTVLIALLSHYFPFTTKNVSRENSLRNATLQVIVASQVPSYEGIRSTSKKNCMYSRYGKNVEADVYFNPQSRGSRYPLDKRPGVPHNCSGGKNS